MKLQYKIWDKPNKQWVSPPYYINQYGDLGVKDMIFMGSDDFDVVLCSGLKHNDSFIYEGSIIYVLNGIGVVKFGERMPNDYNVGFYIDWISEYAKNMHRSDLGYWLKNRSKNIMLIGNIQENKEIIENPEIIIKAYKEMFKCQETELNK